jgi:hypothetical protein
MGEIMASNPAVKAPEKIKGISVITSSNLKAEVIDFRRCFQSEQFGPEWDFSKRQYKLLTA